jgi:hypothetical protein
MLEGMSVALKSVCETLSVELADGLETRLVAKKIIELAQRGVRDVATLTTMPLARSGTNSRAVAAYVIRLQRSRGTVLVEVSKEQPCQVPRFHDGG